MDPTARIAALERQRAEIDDQLAAIRAGVDTRLDPAAIRERYLQMQDTARALLSDLRAVEESFRGLDRDVRAKATTWDGPRGAFLEEVFGTQQEIGTTDQGRSWAAFWEHLLSSAAQDELESLLSAVATLPMLRGYTGEVEQVLRADLFDAAELTQRTIASLSGQLRRFLDDAAWAETRRINKILRATLAAAARAREVGGDLPRGDVDGLRADIALPLERPPHTSRPRTRLDSPDGELETDADLDVTELLELTHIDFSVLRSAVSETLRKRGGIASLGEIVTDHPITDGLAELVGYLQVGADLDAYITDSTDEIHWASTTGGEPHNYL